jgi:hypothetical protein
MGGSWGICLQAEIVRLCEESIAGTVMLNDAKHLAVVQGDASRHSA